MKLSELMNGRTVNPDFAGMLTADDFVLALDVEGAGAPADFVVVQDGITEQSGALNPQTQDSQYIRSGLKTTKTGNQRTFTVSGTRAIGDEFQDTILGHDIMYGTGQGIIKGYVWFCIKNGKGEQGNVAVIVNEMPTGAAGENATFSITLSAQGTPQEYAYSA